MKKTKPHGLTGKPSNRGTRPPTSTRSLRLPSSLWEALEREAEHRGVSVNQLAATALAAVVA